MSGSDFSTHGNVSSFLRSSVNKAIPLIRVLNPDLCERDMSDVQCFESWRDTAHFSVRYLLDTSQFGSIPIAPPVDSN
jgi:hypothetical protein